MNKLSTEKAKEYSRIKTRNLILDILLSVIFIIVFQIFFSGQLSRDLSINGYNFYAACFIYSFIFLFFMYILGLPLSFYNSYIIEHRFGLSRLNKKAWIKDEGKSLILSLALSILCIEVFYLVLRVFPETWWIFAAILWILFTFVLAKVFPVVLIPLFYKYSSIEDEHLKQDIINLCNQSGITLIDVCKIDFSKKTSKANAALVGLGKTRKVILADTLIESFEYDEIKAVVAHELGHCKLRHMMQLIVFNGVTTAAGFYLLYLFSDIIVNLTKALSISDLSLMPVLFLLLTLSGIFLMPLQNLFSRMLERQADTFSLELIQSREAFIGAMEKLAEQNLAEADPSVLKKIFLYSHPTIKERIFMAENFKTRDEEK